MKGMTSIASLHDLKEGAPLGARIDDIELVVVKTGEKISVFQGVCPHRGTLLSGGSVEAGNLVCSMHRWTFDCVSGNKVNDSNVCLHSFSYEIHDDQITVSKEEVLQWSQAQNTSNPAPEFVKSFEEIPGPKKLPLLGNLHQLDLKKLHLVAENWSEQFGPIYKFYMATKPIVGIADETVIHKILRERPKKYRRWSAIEPVFEEMGIKGVFSVEGDDWRRQRRLAMQALNTNHLNSFFPTLARVTDRLRKRWETAAANYTAVDAQKDLTRYTVDITTELAFGYDVNTLEKDEDVIQKHLEKIFPMVNQRINSPVAYWRYFKLPKDRQLDKSLAFIQQEITTYIENSRRRMEENPELHKNPTNFLEGMLAKNEEVREEYSNEEIFGNVLTMLVAGEDTTANTIAWLLYFMIKHPDVQKKMQEEADWVLGDSNTPKDFNDIEKLTYIEAVTHEIMRLKPAAPILFIETNEEANLGGYMVPAHTSLLLLTRKVGMKEKNFSDPESFQPERWLPSSQNSAQNHNADAFMPFGGGPRFCPGRNLALLEVKTVAAMICRNFSLAQSNVDVPVEEQFAFTMMPINLMINFTPRGHN